jgi:ABC-type dipeptide/oligopeptide/nickel transport system permease subunit
VAGAVGTAIALISAVFRGWADRVRMQITDAFLALPYFMIAVTVISLLKPSLMVVILVIGFCAGWTVPGCYAAKSSA